MFGAAYFGNGYFGDGYFGHVGAAPPPAPLFTYDFAINGAYARAFARQGVTVQVMFKRVTGSPPNPVTIQTATVPARVLNYQPDTTSVARGGYPATKPGAITQGDRSYIVMASDLAAAGFPLPLQKNDKAIMVDTGNELNVTAVDAYKRAAAGAIELKAAGVA